MALRLPVLHLRVGMSSYALFYGASGDVRHPLRKWPFLTGVGTGILLDEVVDGNLSGEDLEKAYTDIRSFERQLRDSGTVIFKFFLDISKKEQAQRLQALRENPNTSWRVDDGVLARHYKYDEYKQRVRKCLRRPTWWMVPIGRRLTPQNFFRLRLRLWKSWSILLRNKVDKTKKGGIKFNRNIPPRSYLTCKTAPSLRKVDTSLSLGKDEYRKKLNYPAEKNS